MSSMKWSPLSTSRELNWNSSLLLLGQPKRPAKNLQKLIDAGIHTLADLLWIFPLRIIEKPRLKSFENLEGEKLFLGKGSIVSMKFYPAYGRRGKGRIQLFNAQALIKDSLSSNHLTIRWFNVYPNLKKQLETETELVFMGVVKESKGQLEIVNPKLNPKIEHNDELIVEYPTVNTVPGSHIQKYMDKIPLELWEQDLNYASKSFHSYPRTYLLEAFKVLHGRSTHISKDEAVTRIVFEEFFTNQLKMLARKLKNKNLKSEQFSSSDEQIDIIFQQFPYQLTEDQVKSLHDIRADLNSGTPMMRMIQGDVGCGKTTVALVAAQIIISHKKQVAFMCPTEALARQHFKTCQQVLGSDISFEILLGSTPPVEKKEIYKKLKDGSLDFVIGTHTLFQDSVEFKHLQLAIIDEQHKFGVNQRQKFISKGHNPHTLIMTATPIPRSLQLAQYGDLDISTIRTMPRGRKGIKTRIVDQMNYEKYLSFIKTRIELGEQVYVVTPAIEESVTDLKTVQEIFKTYQKFFPEAKIGCLHGQIKNDEKAAVMDAFSKGEIDILVATTVIEVGIDVANATVISIYNPERFGLSSLHQLRGRVGRADKPGFCFLLNLAPIADESKQRLRVIEKSLDGFEIAVADLKIRGQGDLFGKSQSGHLNNYKLADIFQHYPIFEQATREINKIKAEQTEVLNNILLELCEDKNISSTI